VTIGDQTEVSAPEETRVTRTSSEPQSRGRPYPRWLVASGLLLYSVLFWGALIGAVSGAAKWFTPQPVDVAGETPADRRTP
jgi:hypothetical protein